MKKIVLVLTILTMMVFSNICLAADGEALNKEQQVAENFITNVTSDKSSLDNISADLDDNLKAKFDATAFDTFKNDIKTKLGDLKEHRFYSFERYEQQDKITYAASFKKEDVVAMVFLFNKDGKIAEFGFIPMKKEAPQAK